MAINLSSRLSTTTATPNVDNKYGPYQSIQEVLDTLATPGNIQATNGTTVGIVINGEVVDYVFQNIMSGATPTSSNLVRKISDKKVIMYKGSKGYENIIGQFTLNETTDGDIEIIVPDSAQSDWNASSGPSAILNKPNLATVATSGSYNDLTGKPTIPAAQVNSDWDSASGVSQILNKPDLSHVVYYEDVPAS